MYSVKATRGAAHIDGLEAATTSHGDERGGVVGYYAQNACGSLTRMGYRMGTLAAHTDLAKALEAARSHRGGVCRTCEKAATAALEALEAAAQEQAPAQEEAPQEAPTAAPEQQTVVNIDYTAAGTALALITTTRQLPVYQARLTRVDDFWHLSDDYSDNLGQPISTRSRTAQGAVQRWLVRLGFNLPQVQINRHMDY